MWEAAYESGEDYVGTADDLEGLVGWTGEPGKLATALADAGAPEGHGFIEAIEADRSSPVSVPRYRIHDLWHHAPEYVTKRRKRELERQKRVGPSAKRRKLARGGGHRTPSHDSQTGDARTPSPSHAPSPAPSPSHGAAKGGARVAFAGKVVEVPKFLDDEFRKRLNGQVFDLTAFYQALDQRLAQTGEPWDLRWIREQFAAESPKPERTLSADERPITREEREKAERHLRALGRCPHEPSCATSAECRGWLIRGWREDEAAGLRGEIREEVANV